MSATKTEESSPRLYGLPQNGRKRSADFEDDASTEKANLARHRALKACDYCRKLKTRCLKATSVSVSCVRCTGSSKLCSLELEYRKENPSVKLIQGIPEHLVDKESGGSSIQARRNSEHEMKQKLDLIYLGVTEILALMRQRSQGVDSGNDGDPSSILNSDVKLLLDAASSMKRVNPGTPGPLDPGDSTPHLQLFLGSLQRYGFQSGVGTPLYSGGVPQIGTRPSGPDEAVEEEEIFLTSAAKSFKTLPFSLVARTVTDIPRPVLNLLNLSVVKNSQKPFYEVEHDLISSGILTENEAVDLMKDFRSNYGRWVLFPLHVSTEELITQIRKKSSLLLTTCCALSLRYLLNGKPSPGDIDSHRRKKDTYKLVMRQLVHDLDRSLLKYASFQGSTDKRSDIEFLQAIVILSIYLLSLSSIVANTVDPDSLLDDDINLSNLNLDPWYLSGLGLSTFISKSTFGSLISPFHSTSSLSPNFTILYDELDSNEDQMLTVLRIYNHLVLIHLVSCVLSGRMCVIDEIRLNHCMSALSLPSATNFDGRMVSEISILLIAYNFIQLNLNSPTSRTLEQVEANLHSVKEELSNWLDQWVYLFSQPTLQFVEFCYSFCVIQIYLCYNFAKIEIASKMVSKYPDFLHQYELDALDPIFSHADKDSLIKIIYHLFNLVLFVTKVEDDSYFAYLSDQIHFFFFFGALVMLKVLYFLKTQDKLHYLNETNIQGLSEKNWKDALESVDLLIAKYDRVAQDNSDDVITKYKKGIIERRNQLFPTA